MDPLGLIYRKGKGTRDLTREEGINLGAKRQKGKGIGYHFEIHSDLTYSCADARTKGDDFPLGLSPPTCDIYIFIEREKEREMYTYIYIYTYINIRRPLPEQERARLHCHPPIPSNPADSDQPLLQYLAISYPAN